jgi:hypothetical protein
MKSIRPLLGAVLLLLQLTPVLGAGVCLYHVANTAASCDMPMQNTSHDNDRSHSSPSHDCAHMAVCTPGAPAVPQVALQLLGFAQPTHRSFPTPTFLFPGDPTAPPQPPPIV